MQPLVYVYGVRHDYGYTHTEAEIEIRKKKPQIILHDLIGEDICRTTLEVARRLQSQRHGAACDPRLNKHVYELAKELNTQLYGIDSINPLLHRRQRSIRIRLVEQRMLVLIKKHLEKDYKDPTVIVIVLNDIHLRAKYSADIGAPSIVSEYLKKKSNVKIQRVGVGVRELP